MSVVLSPLFNGVQVFAQGTNTPLSGGFLNTYLAGTATPAATFTDSGGGTPNANPIQLGTDGRLPNEVWLTASTAYKYILTDSLGANPVSFDNISGIPGSGGPGGFTDLTTTGNTILGSGTANTLNVGNGGIVKDSSGNTTFGGSVTVSGGNGITVQKVVSSGAISGTTGTFSGALNALSTNGVFTCNTTAGTSTAYTLTPAIPSTTYTNGAWLVNFNAASGASPTLNISALGAKNLKQYNALGTKIAATLPVNLVALVVYDGTDLVVDAQLAYAQSLTANGYQTLPGGVIMQWGTQLVNIASAATFTFPIAFPTTLASVQISIKNSPYVTQIEVDLTCTAQSTTSVTITNEWVGDSTGTQQNLTAQIIAIGW